MLDFNFQVQVVHVEPYAATPLLLFKLLVEQTGSVRMPVHAIALSCQIRIDPSWPRPAMNAEWSARACAVDAPSTRVAS